MNNCIEQYLYAFSHMRRGETQYGPAPHKLILLLAVIREIEAGRIIQNQIEITDELVQSFMSIWKEYIHTGHIANFALPFFHLQNEGFWQLHAYPHKQTWLSYQNSVSTLGVLQDAVQYATLSQDLFELLLDPVTREELTITLINALQKDGYVAVPKPCPFCELPAGRRLCCSPPGKDEVFFVFYAFDPKLKGYHQTYIDCNRIKLVR